MIKNIKFNTLLSRVYAKIIIRTICLSDNDVFRKQDILLKRMLNYVIKHCPYYKEYFKSNKYVSLESFPIISKEIIRKDFDSFCSNVKHRFVYSHGYTGGSTGEPFHLLKSGNFELDFGDKRWNTYGYKNGEILLAMDGTKIDNESLRQNVYWCKKNDRNIPFGSYALSSLYLTDETAVTYCNYIKNLKPDYLRGYPSFIYSIVCYAENLGIDISPTIKAVELTSESVFQYQIDKIKDVLNVKVFLQYGHTEACVCANTYDETYRYRVEPLYGLVEVLDENGTHVAENEVGEVVVTSLHNFAMPLIRYRTGDYAEYGGKDYRYIYLNKVYGRTQDYIVDRDGNKILLTALIFGQHMNAMGHIKKWQIEQYMPGRIVLHIIKDVSYTSLDENELISLFNNLGNVDVVFDYTDDIKLTSRGKSKMLLQHIN